VALVGSAGGGFHPSGLLSDGAGFERAFPLGHAQKGRGKGVDEISTEKINVEQQRSIETGANQAQIADAAARLRIEIEPQIPDRVVE
jgi:hypothetical protein